MAAPWFALFKAIPWTEVINHAPSVAKGARKLWEKVSARKTTDVAPPPGSPMDARIAHLESRLDDMAARQGESAELLAALATQNADLVRATEALRRRVRFLSFGFALLLVALLVILAQHAR